MDVILGCLSLAALTVCLTVQPATGQVNCDIDRTGLPDDTCAFDLLMKGAVSKRPDGYFCSGYSLAEEIFHVQKSEVDQFIVKFEPLADGGFVHHMLIFGCKSPSRPSGVWPCGSVCNGHEEIIFAWAKNAPPLAMPKGVGKHIGASSNIDAIVVQLHYVNPFDKPDTTSGIRIYTTHHRQPFIAGIYLMLAYSVKIPPNTEKVHADVSCRFAWHDYIVPFGFRTHAHSLGSVITGYKVSNGEYVMIGRGNPQWPQAFYPVETNVQINPGDQLVARCTYNSTGRNRMTSMGSSSKDEMCNFYIMYYMKASAENSRGRDTCAGNNIPRLLQNIPSDSDMPLPPNPAMDSMAAGHHHHHAMSGEHEDPETDTVPDLSQAVTPDISVTSSTNDSPDRETLMHYISSVNITIGQVGGLAVNDKGELHIFHRGNVLWNALSFNAANIYQQQKYPVSTDAIIILNVDGSVKRHFGKDRFFMPHGLSLDKAGNIWVTDVGLHQVFRFPKDAEEPDLTLGIRFEPGTDHDHFCKPSDVVVLSTGEFYVSDGYCNNRIMKFDANGYFVKQWGTASYNTQVDGYPSPGAFNLPHSLALAEDRGLICVADRENGRIQCFDLDGNFIRQIHPQQFGDELYAIEYCPKHGGILLAVNGPNIGPDSMPTKGFTIDINTGKLLSSWDIPQGFTHPHDVTVDTESQFVYVGELNPAKVWKFQIGTAGTVSAAPGGPTKMVPSNATVHVDITEEQGGQTLTSTMSSVIVVDGGSRMDVVNGNHSYIQSEEDEFAPSLIIGTLLVVPVVLLIIVTVIIRLYHTGYFQSCRRRPGGHNSKFNLGTLLNSHKGFDRLSTEDDDHDLENAMDDSDNEEFSIVRKA